MVIKKIGMCSEINQDYFFKIIKELQNQITPSLDELAVDIEKYAEKLYKNADIFVAYSEEKIVGVAAVYTNDVISRDAYLSFIAIYKEYQRKGYGGALLECVEEEAKNNNMRYLKLEVFKKNKNAIEFYNMKNYKRIDENKNSYIMGKQIITGCV